MRILIKTFPNNIKRFTYNFHSNIWMQKIMTFLKKLCPVKHCTAATGTYTIAASDDCYHKQQSRKKPTITQAKQQCWIALAQTLGERPAALTSLLASLSCVSALLLAPERTHGKHTGEWYKKELSAENLNWWHQQHFALPMTALAQILKKKQPWHSSSSRNKYKKKKIPFTR